MLSVIGTWKLGDPLGRGQSGTVYEVTETVTPFRRGALKIHIGSRVKVCRSEFMREVTFVKAQPIPGFMPDFYDDGKLDDGTPWFVMEHAEKPPARLSREQVIAIFDRIAEALQRLDGARHYHGDIKPNNIGMIRGKAVLLDFGTVRSHDETEFVSFRLGTPFYMAPELKNGGTVSARTDVFSLGVTLEELRDDEDHRLFDPIIHHATARMPKERPTYKEFRNELNEAVISYRRDAAKESRVEKVKHVAKRVGLTVVIVTIAYGVLSTVSYRLRRAEIRKRQRALVEATAIQRASNIQLRQPGNQAAAGASATTPTKAGR